MAKKEYDHNFKYVGEEVEIVSPIDDTTELQPISFDVRLRNEDNYIEKWKSYEYLIKIDGWKVDLYYKNRNPVPVYKSSDEWMFLLRINSYGLPTRVLRQAVKKAKSKQVVKPEYKCQYICDRGVHKGKYLEEVCKLYPQYIDFLIREHRHTFPDEFKEALRECGVEVRKD